MPADRVRGTVSGVAYRSSLMKYRGVFHMGVHKVMLVAAGVGPGDDVRPTPSRCRTTRSRRIWRARFRANPKAAAASARLAPSHRREYVGFVTEAKKPEMRAKRGARTIAALSRA